MDPSRLCRPRHGPGCPGPRVTCYERLQRPGRGTPALVTARPLADDGQKIGEKSVLWRLRRGPENLVFTFYILAIHKQVIHFSGGIGGPDVFQDSSSFSSPSGAGAGRRGKIKSQVSSERGEQ